MKRTGDIIITINADGTVRTAIENNNDPGHFDMLKPMLDKLSDGDAALVHAHRHDHTHGEAHSHIGGDKPHTH